jgi:Lon protease-like protein
MNGFGIVMIDTKKNAQFGRIPPIGTHVKIIDFYTLDDGFLGIVVEGIERFTINEIQIESDGLKIASVKYISNWPDEILAEHDKRLADKLADIFEQHPELGDLYTAKEMDNASWLSQRWLELLPMSVTQKQQLLQHANCSTALQLLKEIISA